MNRVNISEQNLYEGFIKLRKELNRVVYQGDIIIYFLFYFFELGFFIEFRICFLVTLVVGKFQFKGEKKKVRLFMRI